MPKKSVGSDLLLKTACSCGGPRVPHRGKNGFVLRNRLCLILYLLDHATGVLTPTLLGDLISPDLVLPDFCRAGYCPICATNHTELFSCSHWLQRIRVTRIPLSMVNFLKGMVTCNTCFPFLPCNSCQSSDLTCLLAFLTLHLPFS